MLKGMLLYSHCISDSSRTHLYLLNPPHESQRLIQHSHKGNIEVKPTVLFRGEVNKNACFYSHCSQPDSWGFFLPRILRLNWILKVVDNGWKCFNGPDSEVLWVDSEKLSGSLMLLFCILHSNTRPSVSDHTQIIQYRSGMKNQRSSRGSHQIIRNTPRHTLLSNTFDEYASHCWFPSQNAIISRWYSLYTSSRKWEPEVRKYMLYHRGHVQTNVPSSPPRL